MQRAQATMLPDGRRLHLQHGPIDLIVEAFGSGKQAAYQRAEKRFDTILDELASEITALRKRLPGPQTPPSRFLHLNIKGPTARRMLAATQQFNACFITPMAAVAGAVADEILAALTAAPNTTKAYANNGGDIGFYLSPGETFTAALADTHAVTTITADMGIHGIATSGWQGRSHSLGIADAVTVLASNAATADAAATMIANATDLPNHASIQREPANNLAPGSDLGRTPVTTAVPLLSTTEKAQALRNGLARAESYLNRGLIAAAHLTVQGQTCATTSAAFKDVTHA